NRADRLALRSEDSPENHGSSTERGSEFLPDRCCSACPLPACFSFIRLQRSRKGCFRVQAPFLYGDLRSEYPLACSLVFIFILIGSHTADAPCYRVRCVSFMRKVREEISHRLLATR